VSADFSLSAVILLLPEICRINSSAQTWNSWPRYLWSPISAGGCFFAIGVKRSKSAFLTTGFVSRFPWSLPGWFSSGQGMVLVELRVPWSLQWCFFLKKLTSFLHSAEQFWSGLEVCWDLFHSIFLPWRSDSFAEANAKLGYAARSNGYCMSFPLQTLHFIHLMHKFIYWH